MTSPNRLGALRVSNAGRLTKSSPLVDYPELWYEKIEAIRTRTDRDQPRKKTHLPEDVIL